MMGHHKLFRLISFIVLFAIILPVWGIFPVKAQTADQWWNDHWPYRILVSVNTSGAVGVSLNFTDLFEELGVPGGLLDIRSLRVIAYNGGMAGQSIPYEETYSTLLIDGETLNLDSGGSEPYWDGGDQTTLTLDGDRFVSGSSSVRALIEDKMNLNSQPGFSYFLNNENDWSAYETLVYSIWPEVNDTAIDQTPDLFHIELLGVGGCSDKVVNGPALTMDAWNQATTSLVPFGKCVVPDLTSINGLKIFIKTNWLGTMPGYFEDGDKVTLWLDDVRLVDQDGPGEIRWVADENVDLYYIYFDTINHEGHPEADNAIIGDHLDGTASVGTVEAGGYFHLISGVEAGNLSIWNAPPVEKIFRTQTTPVADKPLMIHAARGELEPIQLVLRADSDQKIQVQVSDLVNEKSRISSDQIQFFRVDYVQITRTTDFYGRITDWPDPLYPVSFGDEIDLISGENQPLWLRVKVPSGTPAGIYIGTITIDSNLDDPVLIPLTLQVWDFFLPASAFLDLKVGLDWATVIQTYGGLPGGTPHPCYDQLYASIADTLSTYHLSPVPPAAGMDLIETYSLTAYEVIKAHNYQLSTGEPVWWDFVGRDFPPLPNPALLDHPGLDARILPWMAWLDRIDGLYYEQAVDWDPVPWESPFSNDLSNGDGFLFYPPNDATLGTNPCDELSNRLVPSIRLELLREGLEDYAYLWLVNGGAARIDVENQSDLQIMNLIGSRTDFNRSPIAIYETRAALAELLQGKGGMYYLPLFIR